MHGYVIRIGRRIAPLYYTGQLLYARDGWSYELALAAWYASADAAQAASTTLRRWNDMPSSDRDIEYHHFADRAAAAPIALPDRDTPADTLES